MDTLAQVVVAVVVTLLIGIPLGIMAAQRDRFPDRPEPVPGFPADHPQLRAAGAGDHAVPRGSDTGHHRLDLYALPAAVHYTDLGLRRVPQEIARPPTASVPPACSGCGKWICHWPPRN